MKVTMWGGPYDGQEYEVADHHAPIIRIAEPSMVPASEWPTPPPPRTRGDTVITTPHTTPPPDVPMDCVHTIPIVKGTNGKRYALWAERY